MCLNGSQQARERVAGEFESSMQARDDCYRHTVATRFHTNVMLTHVHSTYRRGARTSPTTPLQQMQQKKRRRERGEMRKR